MWPGNRSTWDQPENNLIENAMFTVAQPRIEPERIALHEWYFPRSQIDRERGPEVRVLRSARYRFTGVPLAQGLSKQKTFLRRQSVSFVPRTTTEAQGLSDTGRRDPRLKRRVSRLVPVSVIGSTTLFGSVGLGSNPGRGAKRFTREPLLRARSSADRALDS